MGRFFFTNAGLITKKMEAWSSNSVMLDNIR